MIWEYKFLIIPTFAWFTVQIFKLLADAVKHKRLNFKRFVETGGMPSSHSAVVTSLATLIGKYEGVDTSIFALALIFLTRMVSLGSVGAAILYPVLVLFIHTNYTVSEGSGYLIFSIILAVIVAFNHRTNIKRLMNGTENRISFKK